MKFYNCDGAANVGDPYLESGVHVIGRTGTKVRAGLIDDCDDHNDDDLDEVEGELDSAWKANSDLAARGPGWGDLSGRGYGHDDNYYDGDCWSWVGQFHSTGMVMVMIARAGCSK